MKYDKDAWLKAAKEKESQLAKDLEDMAKSYVADPVLIFDFLKFSSQFHKYSLKNCMLIMEQNPHAHFCASYHNWQQKGAHIKEGEHGIKVYVPKPITCLIIDGDYVKLSEATPKQKKNVRNGLINTVQQMHFGVGNVFDVGQTTFPPDKYPELLTAGYPSEKHGQMFHGLAAYARKELSCKVIVESLSSITLRGSFMPGDNKIKINEVLNDSEKLATLCHELSHAILHSSDVSQKQTSQIEFEADALSIMIQRYYGINIVDSQAAHLSRHFSILQSEIESGKDIDFIAVVSPVYKAFCDNIEKISESIEQYVSKDKEAEKKFARDQIQQMENGPVSIKPEKSSTANLVEDLVEELER